MSSRKHGYFFTKKFLVLAPSRSQVSFDAVLPSIKEKLEVLIEHTQIFDEELAKPKHKGFDVMKKHFKAYVNGFDGAKELRIKLMKTENSKQVEKIINTFIKNNKLS